MGNKIHCAHILVEKLGIAQDLETRISRGESFGNLAKEFSNDVSKKRSGDLDFLGESWHQNLKKLHLHYRKDTYLIS
jgi:parvulin-like peptidyl-prolyl isomerase